MSGQRQAWGWAAALRAGSTTTWQGWQDQARAGRRAGDTTPADPFAPTLPGAQQLALLHRLNVVAAAAGRTVPRPTADRVLTADVSGRGRSELSLMGAEEPQQFGPRPVDPDALPDDELLRVAAALIADDVAATGDQPAPEVDLVTRVRQVRRPWARSFAIVGAQWRADAVHAGLLAQGRRTGRGAPTAYLLADDLGTVLAQAWTSRAFDQGGASWTTFIKTFATAGHLPPRADVARMARSAAQRYGADRVQVVLDPRLLADELGVRSLLEPPRLGAHAVDLVRRVGEPLGLLVLPEERPRLLRDTLGTRLDGLGGPQLTVPRRWETWLRTQAERTRHEIAAAGYPVLGDLDRLVPDPLAEETVRPVDAEVLALALGLLLDPVSSPKESA